MINLSLLLEIEPDNYDPPECFELNSNLIIRSGQTLVTLDLPELSLVGKTKLEDSVTSMTVATSKDSEIIAILLGDSEGRIHFYTKFCVLLRSETYPKSGGILRLRSHDRRIMAVCSNFLLSFTVSEDGNKIISNPMKLIPSCSEFRDALMLRSTRKKSQFDKLRGETEIDETIVTAGVGFLYQRHSLPSPTQSNSLSLLYSAASSFFSSINSQKNDEKHLSTIVSLTDPKKTVLYLESSPDGQYTAIVDAQRRISLVNNETHHVVTVWKGYHHVRVAWITSTKEGEDSRVHLLAFFSQRRKKIQIWSPIKKVKVAEFNFVHPGTFVKPLGKDQIVRFLDLITGETLSFNVPLASVHDPLQGIDKFKRLLNKIKTENNDKYYKELTYLIQSANSETQQCSLLLQTLQSKSITTVKGREICDSLKKACSGSFTSNFISNISSLIELKEHLESCKIGLQPSAFSSLNAFIVEKFSDTDGLDFSTDVHLSDSLEIDDISLGMFMSFVEMNRHGKIEFKSLNGPQLLPLCYSIARGFSETNLKTTINFLEKAAPDLDLLRIFFSSIIQGSLVAENFRNFCPFLKNYLIYASNSEVYHLTAKNFFYHSEMTLSNLGIMKIWLAFVREKKEGSFIDDLMRVSSLVRTYLILIEKYNDIGGLSIVNAYTFNEVFNKGRGKLTSMIASWFLEEKKLRIVEDFRFDIESLFPLSLSPHTFYVHLCWCLFAYWSNGHGDDIGILSRITSIISERIQVPTIRYRLSAVLWNNFAQKYVKVFVKAVEGPEFRHNTPKEIGIPEGRVSEFLSFLSFLKSLELNYEEEEESDCSSLITYDDISLGSSANCVGDFINNFVRSHEYEEASRVQHQAVLILELIWQFNIFYSPLSLFGSKELDEILLPTQEKKSKASLDFLLFREWGRELTSHRVSFLKKCSFRIVDVIEHNGPGDALNTSEFDKWIGMYYALSKYWSLYFKAKLLVMEDLYKSGYDSAGREMYDPTCLEPEELLVLKSVATLRLSKVILQSSESFRMKVMTFKPQLINKLIECEPLIEDIVEVPLRKTEDLFALVCSIDVDPEMIDCLQILKFSDREDES